MPSLCSLHLTARPKGRMNENTRLAILETVKEQDEEEDEDEDEDADKDKDKDEDGDEDEVEFILTKKDKEASLAKKAKAKVSLAEKVVPPLKQAAIGPQTTHQPTIPASPSWKTADKFQVTEIAGKGLGLMALVDIPRGTQILSERPLFLQQNMADAGLGTAVCQRLVRLSRKDQHTFLSLVNTLPGIHPLAGTFRSNMFECRPFSGLFGAYGTAARINHSCLPNVHHSWDDERMLQVFHAVRPIHAGDEVTITYGRGGIFSDQKAYLFGSRGFSCCCERCVLPADKLEVTDNRRILIQRLDDSLSDIYCSLFTPDESLRLVRTLLRELEVEYGGYVAVFAARLYYSAFQVSIAHGDIRRATSFLRRAHNQTVLCHGYNHPYAEKLRNLARVPQAYSGFLLCSRRWLRRPQKQPVDTASTEFDNWLYRGQSEYSVAELEELYPRDCGVV